MTKHYLSMLENILSKNVLELGTATGVLLLSLLETELLVDIVDYSWDVQFATNNELIHFAENI